MKLLCLASLALALLTTNTGWARGVAAQAVANPLLRFTTLPLYAEITHEHVVEAVQHLVTLTEEKIAAIGQDEATDFDSLFAALDEIDLYESRIWWPIRHLHDVSQSDELRAAYDSVEPQIVALDLKLAQHPDIYRKLLALEEDDSLNAVQQRLVQLRLNAARKLGVGLAGEERKRFNAINEELAQLGTKFANNNLDAIKAYQLILRDKEEVSGLPARILQQAAERYQQATGEEASTDAGPWLITLDVPSYRPFMEYSEQRDLREQVYRAFTTLASQPPNDNTPLIKSILQLRQEKALLLGFPDHASLVLSTKMAGNAINVKQLLDELHEVGYPRSIEEQQQLADYAVAQGWQEELALWDTSYWARKMKEEQLNIDNEALRQYFPLPQVLDGLFALLNKMFGISIEENATEVQVWHDDVKFYDVHDADGTHIASFYFDPYSRPQTKKSGAWHNSINSRRVSNNIVEIPVSSLTANFSPPTADKPALLSMLEVTTLFHEFGHGMHALLTTAEYGEVAGTRGVERDAVEMPSKLLEEFIYRAEVMPTISAHVDNGKPLPTEMQQDLRRAENFRAATLLQTQLFQSYIDLLLHTILNPDTQEPLALMQQISAQTLAVPLLATDRFINKFNHIFSIGYDVNYYGYKWGEVLAADAFELFVENGFDDEGLQRSGSMFRAIVLAAGGSEHARDIFLKLRGRLPSAQPLLRQHGLLPEEEIKNMAINEINKWPIRN